MAKQKHSRKVTYSAASAQNVERWRTRGTGLANGRYWAGGNELTSALRNSYSSRSTASPLMTLLRRGGIVRLATALTTDRLRNGMAPGIRGKRVLYTLILWGAVCLALPARAGTATADITVNVTSRIQCTLTTGGLTYNFTSLTIGKGTTLTGRYSVTCDAKTPVTMNTIWDGNVLKGPTYTFSNKDTVEVEYCYAGSDTSCWAAPDNVFSIQKRDLDLRLTYTANSAEKDVVRKGTLQLTYD